MHFDMIVVVVLVGLLAGWLAGLVLDGRGYGPRDIGLGIVGGMVGGAVLTMVGTAPAGTWLGMGSAALLGAVALVFAQRTFWTDGTVTRGDGRVADRH